MIKQYDRQSAVLYAQKWALKHNPEFYYFGGIGGDCTNFISQCLLAGGGIMNFDYIKGWYYISQADRSPSWTSVGYLHNFLTRTENSVGPFAKIVDIDSAEVGDILQLRQNPTNFNHTLIISQKIGDQIYVCAHSDAALNKPLSEYFFNQVLALHIEAIKV